MSDPRDVELVNNAGQKTSVLALLNECRERWPKGDEARARAKAMERQIYGRFGSSTTLEGSVRAPILTPPVSKNKIKNALLTWCARCAKGGTMARAYPNEPTIADQARTEVANAILDYQRQVQNRVALASRAALIAARDGTVGLYSPWDPDAGPHKEREVVLHPVFRTPMKDEAGQTVYKDVPGRGHQIVEPLSIHDFITDGHVDPFDPWSVSSWLLVRRYLSLDAAAALWRQRSQEIDPTGATVWSTPPTSKVEDRLDPTAAWDGVESYEMWWKPDPMGRFTDGLFAIIVGDRVVKATTFPYEHKQIPMGIWRVMDTGGFYGASWVEDAVPQQLGLNHSLRVIAHRAEVSGQIRALIDPGLRKEWGDTPDGMIEATKDQREAGVSFVQVPDIPRDMFEMADRYEAGISDVAGVSDVAAQGDAAADTQNARLVAYATQVDEQKTFMTIVNMNEAFLLVDKQAIEMWKQFVPRERLIRVVGEDSAVSAAYFNPSTEIGVVDVRLEVAPSTERTGAAGGRAAEEEMAAGRLGPKDTSEMRKSGLEQTVAEGEARARLQNLIHAALLGNPVQADPSVPPEVALDELNSILPTLAEHGPRAIMPIRALIQEYQELRQQMQAEANPQAVQQPGRPQGAKPSKTKPQAQPKQNRVQQANTLPTNPTGGAM